MAQSLTAKRRERRAEDRKRKYAEAKRQSIIRTARIQRKIEQWGMAQILPIILRWVENTIRQVSYHSTPISGTFPDISKPLLQMLLYAMASGVWEMNRLLSTLLPRVELSDFNFQGPLEDALDKFVAGKPEKEWNHVIPESGLKWMEGYTYELKGILEKPLLDKIQSVVKEGIGSSDKEGKTEDEVRDELRKILPVLTEHRLQAIARTESMRAYNMGQLVELKKSEEYVQGVEFCAILDSRTTDMCQERDGLILRANDPRVWDNTPPLHPNCRSILIPIIITEEIEDTRWDEDGLKFDNLLVEEPAMIRPKDKEHIQQIMTGAAALTKVKTSSKGGKKKEEKATPAIDQGLVQSLEKDIADLEVEIDAVKEKKYEVYDSMTELPSYSAEAKKLEKEYDILTHKVWDLQEQKDILKSQLDDILDGKLTKADQAALKVSLKQAKLQAKEDAKAKKEAEKQAKLQAKEDAKKGKIEKSQQALYDLKHPVSQMLDMVSKDPRFYKELGWGTNESIEKSMLKGATFQYRSAEVLEAQAQEIMERFAKVGTPIPKKEAEKIRENLAFYTGSNYPQVRDYQRTQAGLDPIMGWDNYRYQVKNPERLKDTVKTLEEFIANSPRPDVNDGALFRGVRQVPDFLEKAEVGDKVHSESVMSTSTSTGTASGFGSACLITFDNPRALRATAVNPFSVNRGEAEYLASSANVYEVLSKQRTPQGGWAYRLRVVGYRTPTGFQDV